MKRAILILALVGVSAARADDARDALRKFDEVQRALNSIQEAASLCYGVEVAGGGAGNFLLSDSLVRGLSCADLTEKNVLKKLQPDAFSTAKQFPVQNWAANALGQCWALALSQREIYYLARFGVPNARKKQDETVAYVLDLLRGTQPGNAAPPSYGDGNEVSRTESPTPLRIFDVEDAGLMATDRYGYRTTSGFMNALRNGVKGRNFRTEIETRQISRFYSPGNLGMIFGSRARSESTNEDTMEEVFESWDQGRMPLLILRAATTAQHAVLVKNIKKVRDGHYIITAYDSNQPGREPRIEYKDRQFYAPEIVGLFHNDGHSPVGVFLKDEDEMDEIQKAVYAHYKELCKGVGDIAVELRK